MAESKKTAKKKTTERSRATRPRAKRLESRRDNQVSAAAKTPGDADPQATVRKLRESLENTRGGLTHFTEMIERSGMRSTLSQYEQLARVLIEQRAWSKSQGQDTLNQPFNEVAELAHNLHEVFAGYAEVFAAIAQIGDEREEPLRPSKQ